MIDHERIARSHLGRADEQLENYYNFIDPEKDRAIALQEAEVNALIGIGHALMAIAGETERVQDQLDGIRLEGIGPSPITSPVITAAASSKCPRTSTRRVCGWQAVANFAPAARVSSASKG